MDEAFQFVRSRANLADADERLRLAEWCRLNGLHEQAVAEVKAAVQLRPDHVATRRLLSYLEESGPIKQTPAKESEEAANARVSIDLTEEALGQFATKVQPILMNACANCHANGRGGAFKLTHAYNSTVLNRKVMQQNLAAVLGEVNLVQPQNSLLLSKAVSVHGSQEQAPIKNRQAAAYHALEEWVWITLANNPQLRDEAVQKAAASPHRRRRPRLSPKSKLRQGTSRASPRMRAPSHRRRRRRKRRNRPIRTAPTISTANSTATSPNRSQNRDVRTEAHAFELPSVAPHG